MEQTQIQCKYYHTLRYPKTNTKKHYDTLRYTKIHLYHVEKKLQGTGS